MKRTILASAAAVALLTAQPAKADIFGGLGSLFGDLHGSGGIISLLEQLLAAIFPVSGLAPMPPTVDGAVLGGTQEPVGQAPGSYVTGAVPSRSPLFPPEGNPEWLPPDGASAYANLRLQDRGARVDEAEAVASRTVADQQAAAARLDGFVLRNAVPDETIAGSLHLGNAIGTETAGGVHELVTLQAEANQLEADQRLQEDWQRKQGDLYAHQFNPGGYWTGVRSWTPGTIKMPE